MNDTTIDRLIEKLKLAFPKEESRMSRKETLVQYAKLIFGLYFAVILLLILAKI